MAQTSTDQAVTGAEDSSVSAKASSFGESLSALVDNEASELEVRRLLKQAESSPEIRERWKRYQLTRAVMHGDLAVDPQIDLSEKISAAIAQERTLQVPGRAKRWRDVIVKGAIAASVTAVFIMGAQQVSRQGGEQITAPLAQSQDGGGVEPAAITGVPSGFELPPLAARTVSTGPSASGQASLPQSHNLYLKALNEAQLQNNQALQAHFNYLLLKHAERSATSGGLGLLPFARVSGVDAEQE